MLKKPNVLLIMSDSLSPHYMGCYGDNTGATPNIDKLAEKGIRFDNAYCNSPLCAPSRASMLTGRYASEIGSLDNANEFSSEWPTMGHLFARKGYETAIVGKMHIVGHDQHHGFDHRLALNTDYTKEYTAGVYCIAYDWTQPSGVNPVGQSWMAPSYINSEDWVNYRHHHDRDIKIHEEAVRYLQGKDKDSNQQFVSGP